MSVENEESINSGQRRMYVTVTDGDIANVAQQLGVEAQTYINYLQSRAMEFNMIDSATELGGLEGFFGDEKILHNYYRVTAALQQRPQLYVAVNSHLEIR